MVDGRIEEAEISDEERSRTNDMVFQQMEHEVGIVMQQVFCPSYYQLTTSLTRLSRLRQKWRKSVVICGRALCQSMELQS